MRICFALFLVTTIFISSLYAQDSTAQRQQDWNFHFQQTVVFQYHLDFAAKYSGENSLEPSEPPQTSITSTFFVGRRLWNGAALYFNLELAGGNGLSGATGVAGFLNGETFRIGDPTPRLNPARFFIKQTFALSNQMEAITDEPNQLNGQLPSKRITLIFGKLSIADYFDNNSYSHDPRMQFLNWALMANGAWDYPADTRGYTWGFIAELTMAPWALRLSSAMVPTEANKSDMDLNIHEAHSETIEIERAYELGAQKGIIRALGYYTQARMGNYQQALQLPLNQIDVVTTRAYGRTKYGFGFNIEHGLSHNIGMMLRASWNDGKNETWMFTEIDRTISSALVLDGNLWQRKGDNFGIALLLNGISQDHRDYLKAGGNGFLIGDGNLNYASEFITEMFYSFFLPEFRLWITSDYQFVLNPAYNNNRGPVHVLGIRAHIAF